MESRGLARKQKLILGVMAGALLGVLVVLGALLNQDAPTSPLATLAVPAAARRTATAARPSQTPVSPTPQPPALTPTPTRIQAPPEILAARRIQELVESVGQIRELPRQQEIVFNFLSEQETAAYLRRVLDDVERQIFVQRQHTLLAALQLLPAPGQVFAPSVQARARRVIAFYDPDEAQIFVGPAGRASDPPDASLVHQYAHALVGQHFDLSSFVSAGANGDATRARDALLQGDAAAVMAIHSFGGVQQAGADALAERLFDVELSAYEGYPTTRAMREVFVFPYRDGMRFVAALLQANWWPDVNAAYLDPPVSTEQILHPEKYVNTPRDEPRAVSLPDLGAGLDEGWRRVSQDVLGELLLRAHLDQYLPSTPQAQAAAAGWDGDLAAVWRDDWADPGAGPREIFVLRTSWDSVDEANEFVSSYVNLIERRLHNASRVRRASLPRGGRWWRGIEGDAYLQQTGDDVLIIWTPDTETMELVLVGSGEWGVGSGEQGAGSGEQGVGSREWGVRSREWRTEGWETRGLSKIKWLLGVGLGLTLLGTAGVLSPRLWTLWRYRQLVYERVQDVPERPVALVLGAEVYPDGRLSAVLQDRVDASIALYRAGKVQRLLFSGDNRFDHYNEPQRMFEYAVAQGVPAEVIVLDYAGRRTYDSCYRAGAIFGVQGAVVVTQAFHLNRALFLCDRLGLDVVGLASDRQTYPRRLRAWWQVREVLATLLAWWDVSVAHPMPVLGEPISIFD